MEEHIAKIDPKDIQYETKMSNSQIGFFKDDLEKIA